MFRTQVDRRTLLKTAAAGAVAAHLPALAATKPETRVAQLYSSLTQTQKAAIVFPFEHPLRSRVANNWYITEQRVGQFFDADQRTLIGEIFNGLHSEEFLPQVHKQIREDQGGLDNHAIALFGEPGAGKFEFVLTGRHTTVRCDGDSVDGTAFGGPIFYGHQGEKDREEPDHPSNVYWYQAKRANEVFQSLDGKQRALALLDNARKEQETQTVTLRGSADGIDGLPVAEMSADQRGLVESVLKDLLKPFREADRAESMRLIAETGGVEALRMAFYRQDDLGGDGVWDRWQLESPTMVWYFRGSPHVHVYVNIRSEAGWRPPETAQQSASAMGGGPSRRRG